MSARRAEAWRRRRASADALHAAQHTLRCLSDASTRAYVHRKPAWASVEAEPVKRSQAREAAVGEGGERVQSHGTSDDS